MFPHPCIFDWYSHRWCSPRNSVSVLGLLPPIPPPTPPHRGAEGAPTAGLECPHGRTWPTARAVALLCVDLTQSSETGTGGGKAAGGAWGSVYGTGWFHASVRRFLGCSSRPASWFGLSVSRSESMSPNTGVLFRIARDAARVSADLGLEVSNILDRWMADFCVPLVEDATRTNKWRETAVAAL